MTVRMTILAENRVGLSIGLIGEHGFCAHLAVDGYQVLWDTGQGYALIHNAPKLAIEFDRIKLVCLSHGHYDHTGGIAPLLRQNGGAELILHHSAFERKRARRELLGKMVEFPVGMPQKQPELTRLGGRVIFVEDHLEVAPGVHYFTSIPMTTPFENINGDFFVEGPNGNRPDRFTDDAALGVVTDQGLSVILGCAHRGMINTIKHIMDYLGVDRLHSVWGGTHMIERSAEEIEATLEALKELQIKKIGAGHCTGFQNELLLAKAFPHEYQAACVGVIAEL